MTAIAANRSMMVGDTLCDLAGNRSYCRKVFRCKNGDIVGIAGELALAMKWYQWYDGGMKKNGPRGDYEALVLNRMGELVHWADGQCSPVEDEFIAIGDGAQACLAVMHCGHSPKIAVSIAKKVCIAVGGRSHIMRI